MRSLTVKVAVSVPVMVRPQVADIKVRMHVPAAEFAPVLKADKCRFTDVFLRGFNNSRFAPFYIEVNVAELEELDNGTEVTAQVLADKGIISLPKVNDGVKILGDGELTKKLDVKAAKFTASAKEKIEKAGGSATEV